MEGMRCLLIACLASTACSPWYVAERTAVESLRGLDRRQVAVRAERESDGTPVLIHASDIEEHRFGDWPSLLRVKTRKPFLGTGVVLLGIGGGFLAVGLAMLGVNGWSASWDFPAPLGPLGAAFTTAGALAGALGIAFTAVGARRNLQEVPPGKLPYEIGVWPVPRCAPPAPPPPSLDDM
jgi:hypothetical protein